MSATALRLLFVSFNHPAILPGGAQQIAYEMFRAALEAGHEAYLLCGLDAAYELKYGAPETPIVPLFGEARQFLFFPREYDFSRLSVRDLASIEAFGEFVRGLAPDVVHFHHYHRIGVEMFRAARFAAPTAAIGLTLHEMMAICMADGQMLKQPTRDLCSVASPVDCAQCFLERRPEFFALRTMRLEALLSECDVFVFPSEFLAERYLAWGLTAEKCVVIPNGLKHPAPDFDRRRHSPSVNRFGFFGQFIDNKGVDVLMEALLVLARENRVPACGLEIEINGGNRQYASAAYLEKIERSRSEIARIGVGPIRVSENGPYDRRELERRMDAVDWVVAPSTWWEVFGLVVSEAWMFGRPVIASDIGGLSERVRDGIGGVTFPVRDARALADQIARLAGAESEWVSLSSAIEAPWNDRQMLDAHLTVWGETLDARRESAASVG